MEQLKAMKEQLVGIVQGQLANVQNVDAKELGEAVDMIKDLAEAMKLCEEEKYYKTVVKAMEDRDKEDKERPQAKEHHHYYNTEYVMPMTYPEYLDPIGYYYRDMDRDQGRMYYGGNGNGNGAMGYQSRDSRGRFTAGRGFQEYNYNEGGNGMNEYPTEMRDHREGQSPIHRKYYMESKELKKDKKTQMEELEKYMKELSKDITEMIADASPEETMLLKQKLNGLAEKIK